MTVSDHRPAVAVPERYPEATEVVLGWPDEVVPVVAPDSRTYVVCLAHNPEVEDVLLPLVLASEARYVGALGSRRTHAARIARLIAAGVPEEQVARLHSPVGLDLGAVTPEEIAASIVAELVRERRRRSRGAQDGGTRGGVTPDLSAPYDRRPDREALTLAVLL